MYSVIPGSQPAPVHPQTVRLLARRFLSFCLLFFPSPVSLYSAYTKKSYFALSHNLSFLLFIKLQFFVLIMSTEPPKGFAVEESNSEREDDGYELRSWSQLGGTDADENDMRMLGRTQQLNVRL